MSIPSGVTDIGTRSFGCCWELTAINVSASNPSYKSISGVLFSKDGKTLMQYPAGKSGTSYTIPSAVTSIGEGAFTNCGRLENVIISGSVTNIEDDAFWNTSLTSVSIPSSVTNIGVSSFGACPSLASINVSPSNPSYKSVEGVLLTKDGKTLIQYPAGKTDSSYIIPSGVVNIGDWAFSGCEELININIPNGMRNIGDLAFIWCEELTSITIPPSVTHIGNDAFYGCEKVNIFGNTGSYAQTYAQEYNIPFTVISEGSQPSIQYRTHVQNVGWQGWKRNGEVSGTSGQSLRLEGIYIDIDGMNDSVEYRTHVQNIGWQGWVSEGQMSGTSGQSLRLEAIQIRLKNEAAQQYDIYYRVHAQNVGWMGWAKNGQSSGTAGYSYRLEAIEIKLVAKGSAAPGSTANAFLDANPAVQPSDPDPQVNVPVTEHSVRYQTHVQNVGWQGWKRNGEMAGTSGQSLRLEGMHIEVEGVKNAIEYRTHVQNIGWQDWVRDGAMTGTNGQSLRLEAIDIRLTGDMASKYDIYYRVHAQNVGWMGWAKNGDSAGTAGYAYRLEGIQIVLVEKGGAAPGSTAKAFIQN